MQNSSFTKYVSLGFVMLMGISSIASAAPKQKIFLDVFGHKGGPLEKLYSEAGRKQLAAEVAGTLQNVDDSAYFIFEQEGFRKAFLISVYKRADGLAGSASSVYVRDEGKNCTPEKMKTMTLDERADGCYYNEDEFGVALRYPGISYDSAELFVAITKEIAEEIAPIKSLTSFLPGQPVQNKEYESLLKHFITMKLPLVLATAIVNEAGWYKNLSETSGWSKETPALTDVQKKLLSALRQLRQDKKSYFSSNLGGKSTTGDIQDTPAVDVPRQGHLMIEHLDDVFVAMSEAGYKYDDAKNTWSK